MGQENRERPQEDLAPVRYPAAGSEVTGND